MKLSLSNISLALGACFLLHSSIARAATITCNQDNCLRALFPTATPTAVSSAIAFCSTYTTTFNYATTGFPTRATAACGSSPSRYSSACSCKPTPSCAPVVATNNLIQNGGFECGLAPWTAVDVVNSTHTLSSPGDASSTAYEFTQIGRHDPRGDPNPAGVAQSLPGLVPGASYRLVFSFFFDAGACTRSNGFLAVGIGENTRLEFRPCDLGQAAVGKFYKVESTFTMDAGAKYLRFTFIFGEGTTVKIDNVAVIPT